MTHRRWLPLVVAAAAACRSAPPPDGASLDAVARRYVVLALGLGQHSASYIDAFYGPDSLREAAARDSLSIAGVRAGAESLLVALGDTVPAYPDSMVRLRHRYLRTQLGSLAARARMLAGERFSFDEEARALYAATPPRHPGTSERSSASITASRCC